MTLTEWLDRQIDIAAAKHDTDNSADNVIRINQTFLSEVATAVMFVDERLRRIEAELGFAPFDLVAQGKRVTRTDV